MVQFFDPDNENDLADAMITLIKNDDLRNQLSKNAKKFVREFKWDLKKQNYLDLINTLVNP